MNKLLKFLLPFLLAAGLLPAAGLPQAAGAAAIDVSGGHVRALPPGVPNTAAYLTIANDSGEDLVLTGASSPAAASVSLHETVTRDGRMTMQAVDAATVPAGGELRLQAGGLHFMLMGLTSPLAAGADVELTLHFEGGLEYALRLPVQSVMAEGGHNH